MKLRLKIGMAVVIISSMGTLFSTSETPIPRRESTDMFLFTTLTPLHNALNRIADELQRNNPQEAAFVDRIKDSLLASWPAVYLRQKNQSQENFEARLNFFKGVVQTLHNNLLQKRYTLDEVQKAWQALENPATQAYINDLSVDTSISGFELQPSPPASQERESNKSNQHQVEGNRSPRRNHNGRSIPLDVSVSSSESIVDESPQGSHATTARDPGVKHASLTAKSSYQYAQWAGVSALLAAIIVGIDHAVRKERSIASMVKRFFKTLKKKVSASFSADSSMGTK